MSRTPLTHPIIPQRLALLSELAGAVRPEGVLRPATVTVRLSTKSKLRNAVALLGGVPVAVNRHGGTTLVVPPGGTTGRKAVLTIKATTQTGKHLRASYVFRLLRTRDSGPAEPDASVSGRGTAAAGTGGQAARQNTNW